MLRLGFLLGRCWPIGPRPGCLGRATSTGAISAKVGIETNRATCKDAGIKQLESPVGEVMSPRWRTRILMAVLSIVLLVLAFYKAPEIGWWGVWLALALLVLTQVFAGFTPNRPPEATRRRQVLMTVFSVGVYLFVVTLGSIWRGDGIIPWSSLPVVLFFTAVIGAVSWFAGRPKPRTFVDGRDGPR